MSGSPDPAPDDPFALAKRGIALRDDGALDAAAAVFAQLMDRFPASVYGWQEMAVLQAMRGHAEDALRLFSQAITVAPDDFLTRRHLVLHQVRLDLLGEAWLTLHAHPTSDPRIAVLQEFVEFIRAFPPQRGIQLAGGLEFCTDWLDVEQVAQRIFAAIEARAPLSFIRLGDGEGSWLSLGPADEARFAHLYDANRRDCLNVWFGNESAYALPSFLATRNRLIAAVEKADILGVPYRARVAHEYNLLSVRGVSACVNILRRLDVGRDAGEHWSYCSHDMHLELHLAGFFQRLAALPVTFGIVSCHPDLGYRLAQAYGARVVRVLIVPEEMGFTRIDSRLSSITGISGMTEAHFPAAYNRVLTRLQRQASEARVWLIAAGYLGKIYCDAVRDAGAVALDIGSIVDGWCGSVTRPYLRSIAEFEL